MIANCEFDSNTATSGGAIYNKGITMEIYGSNFSSNEAYSSGDDIYQYSGASTVYYPYSFSTYNN